MPAELPGYYFDAATNRYYKIQANHIAPSGSNYSRQAVNAEKAIETTQKREESALRSKQSSTVTRSKVCLHPLLTFDRRLGNLHSSARTYLREYYVSSLSRADAFSQPIIMPRSLGHEHNPARLSEQFAVDESTGTLLSAISYVALLSRPMSLLFAFDRQIDRHPRRRHPTGIGVGGVLQQNSSSLGGDDTAAAIGNNWPCSTTNQADSGGHLYSPHEKRVLQSIPKVDCMQWAGPGMVCWAHETSPWEEGAGMGSSYQSDLTLWHCIDADTGTSTGYHPVGLDLMVKLRFQARVLDLAMSPCRTNLAIATSSGVSVMTDLEFGQHVASTAVRGEQMKVAFKDEHVLMSGSRSGKLMFCDTRESLTSSVSSSSLSGPGAGPGSGSSSSTTAAALRIQHSSAISGIAALPDGNRILVNGLTDMKVYDLRFASAPSATERSRHNNNNDWKNHTNPGKYQRTYAPTTPVVTFDVPATRRQNRYGLAFAYDPELDLVLSASTDNYRDHRVGLWSAASGQLLSSHSPLVSHRFDEPVTCADIVRVRDGPKSILLACAGRIDEWCVQGRGLGSEWDQE